jgi:hypothetical protein
MGMEVFMEPVTQLDELTRATRRREFADGLRDFHIGWIVLILGLLNWFVLSPTGMTLLVRSLLYDKSLTIIALFGCVGLLLLFVFGCERLIDRIRRASLWKDSGFVKPLRWGVSRGISILSAAILLIIVIGSVWMMAMGLLSQEVALRSIPTGAGIGLGVTFLGMAQSLKIRRYLWVGIMGILASIPIFFIPLSFRQSYLWFGTAWAIILFASGAWALRRALADQSRDQAHE